MMQNTDMGRRLLAMQMMMQQPMGRPQRPNPNFYTPDWQAIFGPSLDRYQQQAHESQMNQQNSVGGMNGPLRRGLGQLFSGLGGMGGGNFMDIVRRGYQARRGMGNLMPY